MAEKDSLFKNIFFAGIGALSLGADKTKEVVDKLVEQGQLTVDQGKQFNSEIAQKAEKATRSAREDALAVRMRAMTPEEREAFAAKAAEIAAAQNAEAAAHEAAKDDAVAVEAEVISDDEDGNEDREEPAAEDAETEPVEEAADGKAEA